MTKFRTHETPPTGGIRTPATPGEWAQLLQAAVSRARQVRPEWVPGLLAAQQKGQTEAHLRRLGIIHLGDVEREMPLPSSTV